MNPKQSGAYSPGVNHIGVTVDDIQKGIEFYTRVFGFRLVAGPLSIVPDDTHFGLLASDILGPRLTSGRFAHIVGDNGIGLELFEFDDPEAGPRGEMEYWKNGFYHIALSTSDIDGTINTIEAAGGKRRTATWEIFPGAGRFLAYAEDPFGNPVELYTHTYENTWQLAAEASDEVDGNVDGPVTLVVELQAKPETVEQALSLTLAVIPQALVEPYAQSIELFRDPTDPARILLIEKWASRTYVTSSAHTQNAHMAEYFKTISPLLATPARWSVWDKSEHHVA